MTIPRLSFAAFDVKSTDPDCDSICAIRVAVVRDRVFEDTCSWLYPSPVAVERFSPFNTAIHGATADRLPTRRVSCICGRRSSR